MDSFELAILLTTAGAAVGAALIKTLVSAGKSLGIVPEHGRGILIAVAVLSLVLIGLAAWDQNIAGEGITAAEVFVLLLSWVGLYAASVGIHESAVKVQAVVQGTTNPAGPDAG